MVYVVMSSAVDVNVQLVKSCQATNNATQILRRSLWSVNNSSWSHSVVVAVPSSLFDGGQVRRPLGSEQLTDSPSRARMSCSYFCPRPSTYCLFSHLGAVLDCRNGNCFVTAFLLAIVLKSVPLNNTTASEDLRTEHIGIFCTCCSPHFTL